MKRLLLVLCLLLPMSESLFAQYHSPYPPPDYGQSRYQQQQEKAWEDVGFNFAGLVLFAAILWFGYWVYQKTQSELCFKGQQYKKKKKKKKKKYKYKYKFTDEDKEDDNE